MKIRFINWLFSLMIIFSSSILLKAQEECVDTVYIFIENEIINGQIHAHFVGYNFVNIDMLEFSVLYDQNILMYTDQVATGMEVIVNNTLDDELRLIYFNTTGGSGGSISIPDGNHIFTLIFDQIEYQNTNISISNEANSIAILNSLQEQLCLVWQSNNVIISGARLEGHVIHDADLNCNISEDEKGIEDWIVVIENDEYSFFTDTDEYGYYSIIVPEGLYGVNVEYRNNLWGGCSDFQIVDVQEIQEIYTTDFLVYSELDCVDLNISVSTPFLRRCFNNIYTLKYGNDGTLATEDVQVKFTLEEYLTFVSTDASDYSISGNEITFNIGDLDVLEYGKIKVEVYLDCDGTVLGQAHCVTAEISPNNPCHIDASWSGASIELSGYCDSDSVRFAISNFGTEHMVEPSEFIVIKNDVIIISDEIELEQGSTQDIVLYADGSTFRLTVDQVSFHPNISRPTIAIEGCSQENEIATGFVTMFDPGDQSNNIDIDCHENIGSYDPNDKNASPKGYRSEHFIEADTDLEYKIRFQNTGTDTAFLVVVKDQLDPSLDLRSLKLGASSHPYSFSIEEDRTMVFKFDNIYLVDSTTNEPASHGFVKFNIKQLADLNDGTSIYNSADIYFDFNEAIKTNIVDLIIGSDFVEVGISSVETFGIDIEFEVYPNPASDYVNIKLDVDSVNNPNLQVFDNVGKLVLSSQLVKGHNQISLGDLTIGNYYFLVKDGSVKLASGKLSLVSAY